MRGKIIISGTIKCKTGLHIGGNSEASEIGSVDSVVLRNPLTDEPYIPGSSIKGKLRCLLEKYLYSQGKLKFERSIGDDIKQHACSNKDCPSCRIFGTSAISKEEPNSPARLIVRDAFLTVKSSEILKDMENGYFMTEVKFENCLDRITSAANPRQIERIPAGTEFIFKMIYTYWGDNQDSNVTKQETSETSKKDKDSKVIEDITSIFTSLNLLQDDYLGGNGTRGYGEVEFKDISISLRPFSEYGKDEHKGSKTIEVKNLNEAVRKIKEQLNNKKDQ